MTTPLVKRRETRKQKGFLKFIIERVLRIDFYGLHAGVWGGFQKKNPQIPQIRKRHRRAEGLSLPASTLFESV